MRRSGIVPVFSHRDIAVAQDVLAACYGGGIRIFEFTNRGDGMLGVFARLVEYCRAECPEMILGVGSLVDAPTAALAMQYGADFIVGPCFNAQIARLCNRRLIPYIPGCATMTEISSANEAGCDVVKLFPAGCIGGASFVKNALAPMPWLNIMATGAVEPTRENLSEWFAAGVMCVGMGSQLFPAAEIERQEWARISERCRFSLEQVNR